MVKRWEPNMLFCTHYTWIHSAICVNGMSNGAMGPWPHMFHPNVLYCVCELMPNAICMPKMCELCAEHVTWLWFVWYIWRGNRQTHTHTRDKARQNQIFVNSKLHSYGRVPCRKVRRACSDSKQLRHLLTPVRRLHIHDTIDTQFYHFQTHEFVFFFSFQSSRHATSIETRTARSKLIEILFVIRRTAANIHPIKAYISDAVCESLRCH